MRKVEVFLSKETTYGRTNFVLIILVPRSYQNLFHHHLLLPTEQVSSTGNAVARYIG